MVVFKNCKFSDLFRFNFCLKRNGNNIKNKNGDNVGGNKTTNNAVYIFNLSSETELSEQIEHIMGNALSNYSTDLAQGYAQEIVDAVNRVPQEKKIAPKLSTYSTITESLKYMDEKEKRLLFATLIANAMNRDTLHSHQDAFVRIIEQLNKNDIEVLQSFVKSGLQVWGTAYITGYSSLENKQKHSFSYLEPLLFSRESGTEKKHLSTEELIRDTISLENLIRLGLFEIFSPEFQLSDFRYYCVYKDSALYNQYKERYGEDFIKINYNTIRPTKLGSEFLKLYFSHTYSYS